MSLVKRRSDKNFLPVRGERVTLREFRRDDVNRRCAWPLFEDPHFRENNIYLPNKKDRDRWFKTRSRARWLWFAVDDADGRMIGDLSLTRVNRWEKSSVLGIVLSPEFVGKRYGTDAIQTLLRFYFGKLGYSLMRLEVSQLNTRAIRCYEKCGFRQVGEHWKDDLSGLDIFKDDAYLGIREYFTIQRGSLKVRHYDMEVRRDEHRSRGASASYDEDDPQ